MLSNVQKYADSKLVHGSHQLDNTDGIKQTPVTSAMILNVATYPQASKEENFFLILVAY